MKEEMKPEGGQTTDQKDADENKAIAAIWYLGILFLVPLLVKKDSPFAQFHAKQGLVLFISDIVVWIAIWLLAIVLAFIPIIGWIVAILLLIAGVVFFIALFIIGLMNALGGKMKELPLIGQFGRKINF